VVLVAGWWWVGGGGCCEGVLSKNNICRYGHIELGSLKVGEAKQCDSNLLGRFLRQIRQNN